MHQAGNLSSNTHVPVEGGSGKVVIRYSDGRILRGVLSEVARAALQGGMPDSFVMESPDGGPVKVEASEIKAIFFVKSFEGNPNYSEFKFFSDRPIGRGVWVRVHFKDGEAVEGVAPNSLDTYSKKAFYMTPPDPQSNNRAVLVSKHFLNEMEILGLASD